MLLRERSDLYPVFARPVAHMTEFKNFLVGKTFGQLEGWSLKGDRHRASIRFQKFNVNAPRIGNRHEYGFRPTLVGSSQCAHEFLLQKVTSDEKAQ